MSKASDFAETLKNRPSIEIENRLSAKVADNGSLSMTSPPSLEAAHAYNFGLWLTETFGEPLEAHYLRELEKLCRLSERCTNAWWARVNNTLEQLDKIRVVKK